MGLCSVICHPPDLQTDDGTRLAPDLQTDLQTDHGTSQQPDIESHGEKHFSYMIQKCSTQRVVRHCVKSMKKRDHDCIVNTVSYIERNNIEALHRASY